MSPTDVRLPLTTKLRDAAPVCGTSGRGSAPDRISFPGVPISSLPGLSAAGTGDLSRSRDALELIERTPKTRPAAIR